MILHFNECCNRIAGCAQLAGDTLVLHLHNFEKTVVIFFSQNCWGWRRRKTLYSWRIWRVQEKSSATENEEQAVCKLDSTKRYGLQDGRPWNNVFLQSQVRNAKMELLTIIRWLWAKYRWLSATRKSILMSDLRDAGKSRYFGVSETIVLLIDYYFFSLFRKLQLHW